MAAVNTTVNERLRERKDGLREACLALPRDMRPSVYAHCVDIVLADRQLRESDLFGSVRAARDSSGGR